MKTFAAITLSLVMAAALAVPALAQGIPGYGGHRRIGGRPPDSSMLPPESHGHRRSNPEGTAEDLRLAGRCDKAVPILRRIVGGPHDSGITRYNLGMCLLDLAAAESNAQRAADLRQKGAMWVLRGANAGFNLAQKEAVRIKLDGIGTAADPVEAEKWAIIYHNNGMRLALHLPDIAPDIRDRLDAALDDAKRAEAQTRADAWHSTAQALNR